MPHRNAIRHRACKMDYQDILKNLPIKPSSPKSTTHGENLKCTSLSLLLIYVCDEGARFCMYIHTHTHTLSQKCKHTHTHTRTHTRTRTRRYEHVHTYTFTNTKTHTHTHIHTHTYIHTHTHTYTHTHKHTTISVRCKWIMNVFESR